jgi:hypothetical protein
MRVSSSWLLFGAFLALLPACSPRSRSAPVAVLAAAPESVEEAAEANQDRPPAVEGDAFAFPDDSGGQLLARMLSPGDPARLPPDAALEAKPRLRPAAIERPEIPLPPPRPGLPSLPLADRVSMRPRPLPEGMPFGQLNLSSELPQRLELPPPYLVRQTGINSEEPPAPAVTARPLGDRVPLDDPTADSSAAAVIARSMPQRVAPAPFQRMNLPDPFENRGPARSVAPLPEPTFVVPPIVPPKG